VYIEQRRGLMVSGHYSECLTIVNDLHLPRPGMEDIDGADTSWLEIQGKYSPSNGDLIGCLCLSLLAAHICEALGGSCMFACSPLSVPACTRTWPDVSGRDPLE
jgi:hypothetical protein